MFAGHLALLLLLGAIGHSAVAEQVAAPGGASEAFVLPAYLFRLDPDSGSFITIPLPAESRPADVSAVSEPGRTHLWFSEPGLQRIGHVVYTSSVDYALVEYDVGYDPIEVAASATDVWFTVPDKNLIGHIDVASGSGRLLGLPSPGAGPADVAIDAGGSAWVTERAANRLVRVSISSSVTINEYALPAGGSMPEGVTPTGDGDVWLAAGATGYLWRFTPASEQFQASPPLGASSAPQRIAFDSSNQAWVTLRDANQLARLTPGSLPYATFYTIPTSHSLPTAIGIDLLDRVFFVERAAGRIGRLVVTPTVSFAEFSLPQTGLELTGLAVAGDGGVWSVAYRDSRRIYLPLAMNNYDPTLPPFSIQVYDRIDTSMGFTRVVESGARWMRFPALWMLIEPTNTTPENYDWAVLDSSFQTAAISNVHLIVTIEYNPGWAAAELSGPVYNIADLQEFVGALVARYPQVEYWEFYNEPDSIGRFANNGAGYAAMLQAVYPVVKAANPNAKVVMGGLAMDWFIDAGGFFDRYFLETVLANCRGPCFDVANFHFYPVFRHVWESYGRDIIGKANRVRQVLAAYGYTRPVICTEASWASGAQWGSPELQARYVTKVYVRSYAAGLLSMSWFALWDNDLSESGLLGPGFVPRPAYTAYRAMTTVLRGARYVRAISASETGSARIEGYQFSVPGVGGRKRVDVYWYDCPSMVVPGYLPVDCNDTAPLTIAAARVAKTDKFGARVILQDGDDGHSDGRVTIPGGVGSSPIYVDYNP